jgi:hypothetical protein
VTSILTQSTDSNLTHCIDSTQDGMPSSLEGIFLVALLVIGSAVVPQTHALDLFSHFRQQEALTRITYFYEDILNDTSRLEKAKVGVLV